MNYDFMRLILFFDLPVVTKKERRIYAKYRKFLIARGYMMLQYSVYTAIFANRDACELEKSILKKSSPEKGNIRIMMVTEKQYQKMEIIVGGKSNQEEIVTEDPMIVL